MEPAQCRVGSLPHHFREPVVDAGEKPEDPGPNESEMEVCHNKHAAVQNLIGRQICQEDT